GTVDGQNPAGLALVLAADDLDVIAGLQAGGTAFVPGCHHSTSGASETMRMNFFSRSSRATGPKTRVPRGSFWALRITAALPSKRIEDPSLRLISFLVRTMTALMTSPFLTPARGIASFTEATM